MRILAHTVLITLTLIGSDMVLNDGAEARALYRDVTLSRVMNKVHLSAYQFGEAVRRAIRDPLIG